MLVEFSVKNFRSIKEKQTLSMVHSSKESGKTERNIIQTNFTAAPELVESAVIYGPNGSGKSNLINAINFFQYFLISSVNNDQLIKEVSPFIFSDRSSKQASEFEIVFIHDHYIFQYGFTIDSNRVYDEWLYAIPQDSSRQKKQTWFIRDPEDILNSTVGKHIKGEKEVWKKSTRSNALFLSTAIQLNAESFVEPFLWLIKYLQIERGRDPFYSRLDPFGSSSVSQVKNDTLAKQKILRFMKSFDVSFDDIKIIEQDAPNKGKFDFAHKLFGNKIQEIYTIYKTEKDKNVTLNFEDESKGTQSLFHFAAPILDVLENGYTFVVDELSNSLHPHALKGVLSLFSNKKINKNNAQLIFTTHDTNVMNFMDRDQIWLMDKGFNRASTLTSIAEFEGSPNEAIEKRYLSGRYGGLPNIKNLF